MKLKDLISSKMNGRKVIEELQLKSSQIQKSLFCANFTISIASSVDNS